jgi:hypothetical protein
LAVGGYVMIFVQFEIIRMQYVKGEYLMKVQKAIKGCAVLLAVMLVSGCTGMQSDIDALKTRVDLLEQEVAAANASSANSTAAMQAAESAQLTADEALIVAAEGIACCDATNEKVDRMFQRSQSK